MAELKLLPDKEFQIVLKDEKVIEGKYSLWAVNAYCIKKGIALSQLAETLSEDNVQIEDLCLIILCAVEYKAKKQRQPFYFNSVDACDWIEELGGMASQNFISLLNHAKDPAEEPKEDEEKKSLLSGEI